MKTKGIIYLLMVAVAGLVLTACPPADEDPELSLLDPTEVTENGFTVQWNILHATPAEVHLELCCAPDFNEIFKEAAIDDPSLTHYRFEGLHGATRYYFRMRVTTSDGDKLEKTGMFQTRYQSEKADVTTSDGLFIAGDLYYLSTNPPKSPAIILMGHFSISNMWKGEDLFLDLLASGYVCYIFNYRGHPGSDYWDIFPSVSPDQELAWMEDFVKKYVSRDLDACYDHLKEHPLVDSTHIGLMGGSLGANMSMFANNWPGIKVSVGLCTSRLALDEVGVLHNVLFVASEQDENKYYNYKIEAEYLYGVAEEPKEKIIVTGEFHGIDMLVHPSLKGQILEWINARMAD